ncbi:hypothetical protein HanRHA438_Chr17g0835951 [Helianthus annuus]|nr:hypothetical protein HanRHA438_Chr17g0835951 [Helianthus annuus]
MMIDVDLGHKQLNSQSIGTAQFNSLKWGSSLSHPFQKQKHEVWSEWFSLHTISKHAT